MNELNQKYIGQDLQTAQKELEQSGYNVNITRLEPRRDKDILLDEIVIKTEIKDNNINLITSMFKKYI